MDGMGYVRKPWIIRVNDFSFFGFFRSFFPTNPKAQRDFKMFRRGNSWMWKMIWTNDRSLFFFNQIKKSIKQKNCSKLVNRSLPEIFGSLGRNHLPRGHPNPLVASTHIGGFLLGTEAKCTKRGTPRYKTVMKNMAGINCVSYSKVEKHLHVLTF